MAAQIFSFPSLPQSSKSGAAMGGPGRVVAMNRPTASSKVISMSSYTRRSAVQRSFQSTEAMLAKVEEEMAADILEVEVGGITWQRLFCVYVALVREARSRFLGGVRALLRPTPAL